MGYEFEWDAEKAESNARKHGVTFDEQGNIYVSEFSLFGRLHKFKLADQTK